MTAKTKPQKSVRGKKTVKGRGYSAGLDGTEMADGTLAWLTPSGSYYARREPDYDIWDTIAYYNKDTKERIHLAEAQCSQCGQVIASKMRGDCVRCACGESFVDTDHWMPERHRYGGKAVPIESL